MEDPKIHALQFKEGFFTFQSPAVTGQSPVRPDDPVTGHQDRERVMPHGAADGPERHGLAAEPFCRLLRQFSVESCGSLSM